MGSTMTTTPSSDDFTGIRALIVADTWHIAKVLQKLLEDLGIEVAGPVATVPEAERLIAKASLA
jgi:CheY-like chemotaxis protein